jgi:TRAP-type uncharacterized transport system substrate-binding protein
MRARIRHQRGMRAAGEARKRYAILLGTLFVPAFVLLVVVGLVLHIRVQSTTYHLTMTTGSFSGANYDLATQYLVPAAKEHHVDLTMVQSGGSEATLDAVESGKVQVAIVDGGLSHAGRGDVREVAPIYLTALHVLMKKDIYDQLELSGDIRAAFLGKTISISDPGSGTYTYSKIILDYLGIAPKDYIAKPESVAFLTNPQTPASAIPDIVFAASLLPSPVAVRLVHDFDYRLYPLDFVDAFRLQDKAAYGVPIPKGAYGVSPEVPPTDIVTLGRRLLIVTNKNVPDQAIKQLTAAIFESDFAKVDDPPLTLKQFDLLPEFPRAPGALAYVASQTPISQDTINNAVLYLTGIAAWLTVVPGLIFLVRRPLSRRIRQMASLKDYIVQVTDVEAAVFDWEESGSTSLARPLELRRRLARLKLEAMDLYKQGRIEDPNLLEGFLAHLTDLRIHLDSLLQAAPRENGTPSVGDAMAAAANGTPSPVEVR